MPLIPRRLRAALLATASATLVAATLPAPVPLGIGDSLFPHLGNPGYDVLSYDIGFTYHGNNKPLDAVTTIDARTTEPLDRINLDFARGSVRSVDINGLRADFAAADEDLVVEAPGRLPAGVPLHITVRHTSDPSGDQNSGGWLRTSDGLAMANQADAAHRVFPSNDHPADKAYFTFRVTAPEELTVVANGLPAGKVRQGSSTTWTYRTAHPMATELAQVSIGRSTVLERTGPHGLPVRDVVPTADAKDLERWLKKTPGQLEWMERQVGRYPFETYGVLVADTKTGFELETQTLTLFERSVFTTGIYPEWYVDSIMVHELAHQWFGNSVSPQAWSDLWLNEGHASWYEARYAEEHAKRSLERRMRDAYTRSDSWRAAGGPPARPVAPSPGEKISIFRPAVYDGSALVLYALRQEIGEPAFDQLERSWVRTHRDSTATTKDFVRLASQIAGRDLTAFFDGWLYRAKTPPMPGHPDWHSTQPTGQG
ncbi:M1 family metallopeptidase [Streptomyces sp. NBC_01318]|uniref:M1 family metallopeptidase n=1 Tax=unclassified Streptomyces TaxID=2593676 RepID=UPI002DD9A364|nr:MULTISPECIES: M1 family metallopeptidase [unclassified Streptomyces]WSC53207.1 M1 family metallopeptidase [Streptomyces sp. NBC_01761]WSJ50617.1 M1 family metallopeptidase [Streptomyces sp. NBC_01318]